jgi:hypothetical protein
MLPIRKQYILDESQQPMVSDRPEVIAVQISIEDFHRLEAILEDYGLAKLMDEVSEDDRPRVSQEAVAGLSKTEFYCDLRRMWCIWGDRSGSLGRVWQKNAILVNE